MSEHDTITENEKLHKTLIRVALPIAAQSLIASSLSLVDNLMVGKLGETELATVGLSTQIFFIFWMLLFGFTGGTITYMAQFWGKKDLPNIRKVTGISLTCCFSVGLLFFLICLLAPRQVLSIFTNIEDVLTMGERFIRIGSVIFLFWSLVVPLTALLRATQQTKIPLQISAITFAVNTAMGLLLIFGLFGFPRYGFMGACYAVLISRVLEFLLYIYVIFIRRNIVAARLKDFFDWDRLLFRRVLNNSIPTTLNESLWGIGVSMYNAAYGRVGVTEFAAVQAANTIQNIFSLACFSIGDAMLILVGEKLGKGEMKEAYRLSKHILLVAVGLGFTAGMIMLSVAKPIAGLFEFSPDGVYYTILILIVYSAVLFIKIHNAAQITGTLRSGGDTRFALIAEISCVWLIGVPMAFFCVLHLHLPIYLAVLAVQSEEIIKGIILLSRYRSKKWVRNLVDHL